MLRKMTVLLMAMILLAFPARAAGRYSALRLIASGSALSPVGLEAGGRATLTVMIQNPSRYSEARNCKFTLEGGAAFIPDGAASVYVERIGREEDAAVAFALYALPDAAPGWVEARVLCEYEDDGGTQFSSAEGVWLEIRQPIRLEHSAAILPQRVTEGASVAFQIDLMNMGKGTLYNALLTFDLPFLAAPQSVLVGEIAPGSTQTGRTNLFVETGRLGEASGTLVLSCENAAGERWEETVPLTTTVEKKPAVIETTAAPEKESLPAWVVPSCIATAGAAAVICLQLSLERRRRRERDERML